jgi:hypothetical protein
MPNNKVECTNYIKNDNDGLFIVIMLIHRCVNMYHKIEIWSIDWYI